VDVLSGSFFGRPGGLFAASPAQRNARELSASIPGAGNPLMNDSAVMLSQARVKVPIIGRSENPFLPAG